MHPGKCKAPAVPRTVNPGLSHGGQGMGVSYHCGAFSEVSRKYIANKSKLRDQTKPTSKMITQGRSTFPSIQLNPASISGRMSVPRPASSSITTKQPA